MCRMPLCAVLLTLTTKNPQAREHPVNREKRANKDPRDLKANKAHKVNYHYSLADDLPALS